MRFEGLTAKISVHPQASEAPEDFRPRLVHQLGFMLAEKIIRHYGEELSVEPSNFADHFTAGFNDVKLKVEVPILSADEVAALRADPKIIERAIGAGEVVIR